MFFTENTAYNIYVFNTYEYFRISENCHSKLFRYIVNYGEGLFKKFIEYYAYLYYKWTKCFLFYMEYIKIYKVFIFSQFSIKKTHSKDYFKHVKIKILLNEHNIKCLFKSNKIDIILKVNNVSFVICNLWLRKDSYNEALSFLPTLDKVKNVYLLINKTP